MLVFDLLANGNVAPKRVLGGPDTGFTAAGSVAIDATRNIIVVGAEARSADGRGLPQLAIFDRTAAGNVKPKRVITGVKSRLNDTGNIRIYPEGGLVFTTQQTGYVAVWSLEDNGDVPPRYTVGGPERPAAEAARARPRSQAQRGDRLRQAAERGPHLRDAAAVPADHFPGGEVAAGRFTKNFGTR